jgi:formylglycine-generating enzyme required for sulfatase activity
MSLVPKNNEQPKVFVEKLNGLVRLGMMRIAGGTFLMGSPTDEINHCSNENPQHSVTVPSFYMGRYPVIQEQWRVVAGLPKVERELIPEFSYFKGDNHPVEQVSWFEAQEFCARLSFLTNRKYRLPSEAEWEYACRGRTTTPFYFGKTIADLANYCGVEMEVGRLSDGFIRLGPRDPESTGIYRKNTTPVEMFPANIFGLCDMHGNVWEWCLDHYHDNYEGAPADGSAWIDPNANWSYWRTLRGGCWDSELPSCRSASRHVLYPVSQCNSHGFRVVCEIDDLMVSD